ncbi:fructosamine kinase family protein, partial [Escherichia coli]|nr:fructosamine kinase family protein [Escherichia coli]
MADPLRARIETLTGARVTSLGALHGGDLSDVYSATLEDGRQVVAKMGALVDTEARMLQAMAAAGAPVPRVLATQTGLTILEMLDEAPASPQGWAALGHGLRRLHDRHGTLYGWEQDYAFGPAPIPNAPRHDWPVFWAEQRLLAWPADLPMDIARRLDALAARLPDLLPAAPPPALLHGDLWAGNVLFGPGGTALMIDPACYYGDAEVDLA